MEKEDRTKQPEIPEKDAQEEPTGSIRQEQVQEDVQRLSEALEMAFATDSKESEETGAQSESEAEPLPVPRPRRSRRSAATRREEREAREAREREEEVQSRRRNDDEEQFSIPEVLPVLPLKDTVIYPFSLQPLGVGQERSLRLIDHVMNTNRLVVLVAQKDASMDMAGPADIFKVGTVSRVVRMFRMPDGTVQIVVQGLERVEIGEFIQEKPFHAAHITPRP